MIVADGYFLIDTHRAALNAADTDTAHVIVVVDGGNQELERLVYLALGAGDILQDRIEQRTEVLTEFIRTQGSRAGTAAAEQHRRIQLLVGGVQIHQKLQGFVNNLIDTGVGAVHLIDHHDDAVVELHGTLQNEAGLGHGALGCVHQKDYAVDHLQNTLDLAAEVCVSGGVYDVDLHTVVLHRGIFCEDRDAAFLLDGTRVHNTLHHGLIFMVRTALLQHTVHQGSLTVVNVGDDRYVAQIFSYQNNIPIFP